MQNSIMENNRNYIDWEYLSNKLSEKVENAKSDSKGFWFTAWLFYAIALILGIGMMISSSLLAGFIVILLFAAGGTILIIMSKKKNKIGNQPGSINPSQPNLEIRTVHIDDIIASKRFINFDNDIDTICSVTIKYSDGTKQIIKEDYTLFNAVHDHESNYINKECYLFLINGVLINEDTVYYTSIYTLAPELQPFISPPYNH